MSGTPDPTTPPAAPAEGAPATPPETPPAPAAATEPPAAPPAPQANPWDDPTAAKAEIEKLRRENQAERLNAKATAAAAARQELAQTIGKTLGLVKDDETTDPAQLTQALTASQADAKNAARELAIYKQAGHAKADPAALLDSRDFMSKVAGIEPTDTQALAAAISEATTSNPRFKATQAAAVGGADLGTGGSAPARTYTREQLRDPAFYQANKTDILAAQREGRILT